MNDCDYSQTKIEHSVPSFIPLKEESPPLCVAIMGMGYVGTSVLEACIESNFSIVGIDIDQERVQQLQSQFSDYRDACFQSSPEGLHAVDVVFICVPTPIEEGDGHRLVEACAQQFAAHGNPDALVILESTVRPGFVHRLQSLLGHGGQVALAYAPERIDPQPNGKQRTCASIPRLLGGIDDKAQVRAQELFVKMGIKAHTFSLEVIELAKLYENTYRLVNISLSNEMAALCGTEGINFHDVVDAAGTKPFGFASFYPSIGAGGHCIPIDPTFIEAFAQSKNIQTPILSSSIQSNLLRPKVVAEEIFRQTKDDDVILAVGVTYKKGVCDMRESKSLEAIRFLQSKRDVLTFDELVQAPSDMQQVSLSEGLQRADVIVLFVEQSEGVQDRIKSTSKIILDTTGTIARGVKI